MRINESLEPIEDHLFDQVAVGRLQDDNQRNFNSRVRQIDQEILPIDEIDIAVVCVSPTCRPGLHELKTITAVLKARLPRDNHSLRAEMMLLSEMRMELLIRNASASSVRGMIVASIPHLSVGSGLSLRSRLLRMVRPLRRRLRVHLILPFVLFGRISRIRPRRFCVCWWAAGIVRSCLILSGVVVLLFIVLRVKQRSTR